MDFLFNSSFDSSLVMRRWRSWKFLVFDSIRFRAEMSESRKELELRERLAGVGWFGGGCILGVV